MTKIQIILIALAVILLAVTVGVFAMIHADNADEAQKDAGVDTLSAENFQVETVNSKHVILSAGEPIAQAGTGIEQRLTATVYPSTATNKLVDWSVAWGDSSSGGSVTDYVTVTPDADGSTNATVTCYQPFSGVIVITVTTRESGYTAECLVTYEGKPTGITVTTTAIEDASGYHLGAGQTYTFGLSLTNPFGEVDPNYNNFAVELGAVGSILVGSKEVNVSSGNIKWYDATLTSVTLDSLKDKFISVNYENGTVTVNTIKTIESYFESVQRIDGGRTQSYKNAFNAFEGDCYFTIQITEQNSGYSKTLKVYIDQTVVTGVEVDTTEMVF